MQHCPSCGYQSPEGTRFCRQCGEQLNAGSDPLEATTRNWGRGVAAPSPSASMPLPPSIGDAVAGNTARYQRPAPVPQMSYTPPVPVAPSTASLKKKGRRLLKFGALLLALLASGGIGAAINEASNRDRIYLGDSDRVRLERMRIEDETRRTVVGSVEDYQDRTREQLNQRLESIERAKDDAERAASRGDLPLLGEKAIDLSVYEYPGASAGQFSRIPGREMMTQRTKDDLDTVVRYYQEKLGKPFIQTSERNSVRQILFQTLNTPSVTVLVRDVRDRTRQPEIIILRSPFRFPSLQAEQDLAKPEEAPKPPVVDPKALTKPATR
jgi:hypothetical protein